MKADLSVERPVAFIALVGVGRERSSRSMHVNMPAAYKVPAAYVRLSPPTTPISIPPIILLRTSFAMSRIVVRSLLALAVASVALCAPEPQLGGLSFTSDGNSGLPGGANNLVPVVQNLANTQGSASAIPDLGLSAGGSEDDSLTGNLPSSAALQDGLAARPNDLINDLEDPYPSEDEQRPGRHTRSQRQTAPNASGP